MDVGAALPHADRIEAETVKSEEVGAVDLADAHASADAGGGAQGDEVGSPDVGETLVAVVAGIQADGAAVGSRRSGQRDVVTGVERLATAFRMSAERRGEDQKSGR